MQKPKIISGGQTGVDQGALEFALDYGFECGGFCPKGRKSEKGTIPFKYPVVEIESENEIDRTQKNVLYADATIIVKDDIELKEGTLETIKFCKQYVKPYQIFDVINEPINYEMFAEWLKENNVKVMNVAGNRSSDSPGIKGRTYALLEKLFNV